MLLSFDGQAQTAPVTATPTIPTIPTPSTPAGNYDALLRQAELALKPTTGKPGNLKAAVGLVVQAVKVAPDDDKKYRALSRAASMSEGQNDFANAANYYETAGKLKNISGDQKALAQLNRARAQYQTQRLSGDTKQIADALRKNIEAVLALPDASVETKIQAHNMLTELDMAQGAFGLAAGESEKILALLDANNAKAHQAYFERAFGNLKKAAPDAATLALGERLFPPYLALQTAPLQAARVKNDWAQILASQNQAVRAMALWNEVAEDAALPITARAEILRSVNRTQRVAKDFTGALATADRVGAFPKATPEMLAWRGWDRASTFSAQGDEAKMREELQLLIASPQITPGDKSVTWMEIAKSCNRQRLALPANSAAAAPLLEQAKKAYEAAWSVPGVLPQHSIEALIARSQLDVDTKNYKAAADRLLAGIEASKEFRLTENEHRAVARQIYFSLAAVYVASQQRTNALTALVGAQQNSPANDVSAGQNAITLSQQAYAAKDWPAARNILSALQNVWGLPFVDFLINRAQIEVGAQNWPIAKKALNELADQPNLSAANKKVLAELRAQLPK